MNMIISILILTIMTLSMTSPLETNENITYDNDKYYCTKLLPGEDLLSEFGAELRVTDSDVIYSYNNNDNTSAHSIIGSCENFGGIKELKLEANGLKLYCNNNHIEYLAKLEVPRDVSSTEYYKLTIKYIEPEMENPNLMIIDTKTSEAVWGYYPIRYLSSLEQVNKVKKDDYGRIYEDNTFSIFDKMKSTEGDENYIYLSIEDGLKLKDKSIRNINNMKIENNNFLINNKIVIKNKKNMELSYNGVMNKLIMVDKTKESIWELYGSKICDEIISNNENCNIFYAYNQINIKNSNEMFYLKDNVLNYSKNIKSNKINKFDISKYTSDDPIFSINLNSDGSIGLNNNQYFIHKEYFIPEKYYRLKSIGNNLILISNTGEFKWALNKNISNRKYDASIINIDDSFSENEMIYCGDYSVIILGGKLIYRDHKAKTSSIIKFSRVDNYLTNISVYDDSIVFYGDESVGRIYENISPYGSNPRSALRCEKSNHGIVWDNGDGKILWSYPEYKQTTTIKTTTTKTTTTTKKTTTTRKTTITKIPHTYTFSTQLSKLYVVTKTTSSSVPYITTTPVTKSKTYYSYSFQGTVHDSSFYYIGVNNLSVTSQIKIQSSKFNNWLFESPNNPSKMYLANGSNALTDICLSVSNKQYSTNKYYMNLVKCGETNYKFKFNTSRTNSNDGTKYANILIIYNNNNVYKVNGNPMCAYYDEYLFAYPCNDPVNYDDSFGWKRTTNNNYVHRYTENVKTTSYSIVQSNYPVTSTSTYYSTYYSTSYETLTIMVDDEPTVTLTITPTPMITKAKTTTTTTTTSSPTTTNSLKGKCGPNYNNQVCSSNECCSSHGRCGRSDDHCSIEKGCQIAFGRCNTTNTSTSSPTTTNSLKGKCGPNYNNQVCSSNECCSSHGRCGRSDDHCSIEKGCQIAFGRCNTTNTSTSSPTTTISLKGKCGPNYNNQVCSGDDCCSSHGRCGRSDDHCSIEKGCQIAFGRCN